MKRILLILLMLSVSLFIGCSRNLTRAKAAEVLKSSLEKDELSLLVRVGTFGEAGSPCWEAEQMWGYKQTGVKPSRGVIAYLASTQKGKKPSEVTASALLTDAGYLTVSRTENSRNWSIALTDKAREVLSKYHHGDSYGHEGEPGCETSQYTFPLATFQLDGITGIVAESKGSNSARVDFVWKWKATEFGLAYQSALPELRRNSNVVAHQLPFPFRQRGFEDQQFSSAEFRLYDDGWRFENVIGAARGPVPELFR